MHPELKRHTAGNAAQYAYMKLGGGRGHAGLRIAQLGRTSPCTSGPTAACSMVQPPRSNVPRPWKWVDPSNPSKLQRFRVRCTREPPSVGGASARRCKLEPQQPGERRRGKGRQLLQGPGEDGAPVTAKSSNWVPKLRRAGS